MTQSGLQPMIYRTWSEHAQDKAKKERFRQKITQYMDRAEQLKLFVTEAKNGMCCLYKKSFVISSIIKH
jgi:hypothetical protein